jgi:NitT/TauT family transport system substrate-binding protein/sulfonate transport system substrate-binding protein
MKKSTFTCILILLATLVISGSEVAMAQQQLIALPSAWMPEHEVFFPWYAKEKGWDKEEGLDLKILYFESGMAQLEALPAKKWFLGSTGGLPHVMGALRYGAYMIGLGNDESFCNAVYVRPDSPVMKSKGVQKGYPQVYGKAEDIKGKTFLVTTVSSAHYAMGSYLRVFGLADKDVVVKHMDQASIMAAFEKGIGDFAALWAPYTFTADEKGWKEASNVNTCKAAIPITFIGDKEYCDKNPQVVAKFLRVMFRSINKLKEEGATDENVKLYQRMYKEWAGMEFTYEAAKKDIQMHPVWKIEEQLKLFDGSKGEGEAQRWERLLAEFLNANGRIKDEELAKVKKMDWVTGKFLKMVKTPIPSYK